MMEMNYFSTVNVTKAVITSMIEQQFGRIVFVSSVAGQVGVFGFTAYSAAKFALRGFAEALQMEASISYVWYYFYTKSFQIYIMGEDGIDHISL